jgi:hypothetical protein
MDRGLLTSSFGKLYSGAVLDGRNYREDNLLPSLYAWYVLPFSSLYLRMLEPIEAVEMISS